MSYLKRKAIAAYGVSNYLDKKGFDITGKGFKANAIMIKFLQEHSLPFESWSKNYKGLNTADLINAETVQDNWKKFTIWVNLNRP